MCHMRLFLVFFLAVLAGYVAWRKVGSSSDTNDNIVFEDFKKIVTKDKQEFSIKRMVQNGFWVFVDMANGRHLWRNLNELKNKEEVKSC